MLLCDGSVRENSLATLRASFFLASESASNSRPVKDFPFVSSSSVNRPILRQMDSAVSCVNQLEVDSNVIDTKLLCYHP